MYFSKDFFIFKQDIKTFMQLRAICGLRTVKLLFMNLLLVAITRVKQQ